MVICLCLSIAWAWISICKNISCSFLCSMTWVKLVNTRSLSCDCFYHCPSFLVSSEWSDIYLSFLIGYFCCTDHIEICLILITKFAKLMQFWRNILFAKICMICILLSYFITCDFINTWNVMKTYVSWGVFFFNVYYSLYVFSN
jgi:hypothetical protein